MYLKTAILIFFYAILPIYLFIYFSHSRNTYLRLLLVCLSEFVWDFGFRVLFANNLFVTEPEDVFSEQFCPGCITSLGTGHYGILQAALRFGAVYTMGQFSLVLDLQQCSSSKWLWTFLLTVGLENSVILYQSQFSWSQLNSQNGTGALCCQWWSLPTWKAPFPALCKDLKGFIKSGVLAL